MKWLIGCIVYSVLLLNQIHDGLAAPPEPLALSINLPEIQSYANQYHDLIEQTLYVYRSEFNRILREDGINNSLSYLNHEAALALDIKDEFVLQLWLSKSNDCYNLLTPKSDSALNETGHQFSVCSASFDEKVTTISSTILTDIQWQQAASLELQRITITEMTRFNVFTQPDEMKDSLRTTLTEFETYWRGTVEPNVVTNLMTFRIELQDATRQFNYCLQDQEIAFRKRISELKLELTECIKASN